MVESWPSLPPPPRHAWPFLMALAGLLAAVALLVVVGVISFAYGRLGVGQHMALALLLLSLVGSLIDLPVARLRGGTAATIRVVRVFGVRYLIPEIREWPGTVIAVNVGGALVPACVSTWIVVHTGLWWQALAGTAAVALVAWAVSRPVEGVGIVVPGLVPPAAAALAGVVLVDGQAAPIAYVAGTLGTIVGADLLNLRRLRGTGAAVASIGGAGTFDAVFLAGILAVVLAGAA